MNRFKNYGLWVSIFALLPMLCEAFGWHVLPANYESLINSILGILVVAGILNNPTTERKDFLDDKTPDETNQLK